MCFVNDYDWTANVCVQQYKIADRPITCSECRHKIKEAERYFHVFLQEYEYCRNCEDGYCECGDECCKCAEPDTGESYESYRCMSCDSMLAAIASHEFDEGCAVYEAYPALDMMFEELSNLGLKYSKGYFKKAVSLFPELKKSGYLAMVARRCFG